MPLQTELQTFERNLPQFRDAHLSDWVLISGSDIIGFFSSFEQAAFKALQELGDTEYLISQIGAEPVVLPFVVIED